MMLLDEEGGEDFCINFWDSDTILERLIPEELFEFVNFLNFIVFVFGELTGVFGDKTSVALLFIESDWERFMRAHDKSLNPKNPIKIEFLNSRFSFSCAFCNFGCCCVLNGETSDTVQ